jgi:hypothetical protein
MQYDISQRVNTGGRVNRQAMQAVAQVSLAVHGYISIESPRRIVVSAARRASQQFSGIEYFLAAFVKVDGQVEVFVHAVLSVELLSTTITSSGMTVWAAMALKQAAMWSCSLKTGITIVSVSVLLNICVRYKHY